MAMVDEVTEKGVNDAEKGVNAADEGVGCKLFFVLVFFTNSNRKGRVLHELKIH